MRPAFRMGSLLLCMLFMLRHEPRALAANSAFSDGLWELGFKRYHAAEGYFEKAVDENPQDAAAHYYLGKCLRHLKEFDAAKDELSTAFRLNPFSPEGQKARNEILEVAAETEQRSHPADTIDQYGRALSEINRQSAEVKGRWINWGNQNASFKVSQAAIQSQNIIRSAHEYMHYYVPRHARNNSTVLNDAQLQAHYALTDGRVQANKYRRDANHAAAETQQSANTLKQLLAEPAVQGKPHLRAFGTNLYVRNYSAFDDPPPDDPMIQLRAIPKRLSDAAQSAATEFRVEPRQSLIAGTPHVVPTNCKIEHKAETFVNDDSLPPDLQSIQHSSRPTRRTPVRNSHPNQDNSNHDGR